MRRLFGWTAGLVGIAALARMLARRQQARTTAPPAPAPDPAEELRRKLDESRGRTAVDDVRATSVPAAEQSPPAETLDERRARVHAKAQEALEAMEALQEPPA